MEKDLNTSFLNEIYGSLLTSRQREIVSQYFDYDLSLQEISDNLGISRQAVLDAVQKGGEQLREYEKKLGIFAARKIILSAIGDINDGFYDCAEEKLKKLLDR